MKLRRFTLAIAGVVLLGSCGGPPQLPPATTDPAGSQYGVGGGAAITTAGGQDGSAGNVAICGDIQSDPRNCGACGHDCIGGACIAGACQPVVLAAGLEEPGSMAIDDTNVYWTEYAAGQIVRIAKAGGAPIIVASGLPSPGAIAVSSGNIYWTDAAAGTVSQLAVDGGSPVVLATGLLQPNALAVDASDVYFWTIGDHTIRHLAPSPVVVASDLTVAAMVLDAASLYCATFDGSILKIPRQGGNAQTLASSPVTYPGSGLTDYGAWGVAIDTANAYWTYRAYWSSLDPAMVLSVPLDGGTPTILCAQCAGALAITADPSGIYWTEIGPGNIETLRGGGPAVLASAQRAPEAIATDGTNVYWLDFGPNGSAKSPSRGGAIMRLAK